MVTNAEPHLCHHHSEMSDITFVLESQSHGRLSDKVAVLEAENREMKSVILSIQAELARSEHDCLTGQYANETVTSCKSLCSCHIFLQKLLNYVQQ